MVQDWIDKKPTAHNWKAFFNSIIQMHDNEQQEASSAAITKTVATNNNDREEQWEEQLRLALREGGLFLCDVNNDESLVSFDFDPPPQFDMIYSSLCLEVCKTVEHFKQTIKRLERLLKPGGLLLVNGVTNKSYYHVGNKIIYSLSISAKQVSQAFEDAGITDNLKFISKPRKPNLKCDDCEGLYTIFAFKPSK
ncbi:unnamed protein product [Didymodactylos carnosus]|uniref:Methyltransferase type 11 domain-containing protein n=1 Tax=Didymodactylos carnosus TaxID=1234261 RepID=A0A815EK58_9BILA|nr:unnamed protein product [Didymodactylos carnosus]CAF1313040.1 unnamed protein product [Didymodactylos carnosus]CAF3827995.1 unnamed protein product [Didymodactylos carnosus]CAF4152223.1 unnamed protein product [Didymodactylos carnosus]